MAIGKMFFGLVENNGIIEQIKCFFIFGTAPMIVFPPGNVLYIAGYWLYPG